MFPAIGISKRGEGMTYNEAMQSLAALPDDDPERGHREAELILLQFMRTNGHPQIAERFEETRRRIGFWYA